MGVKNTTIGQVLGTGALAFVAYQAYKRYVGKKQGNQVIKARNEPSDFSQTREDRLDHMLEDTFPASDPMPLSRTGSRDS